MIRTRFAPSPTGYLHVGGARTALFSWLTARAAGGVFILRIEDTDRERSTAESVQAILDGMAWLELDYDEGPYYQSARLDRYNEAIERMLDNGLAYHCDCPRERLEKLRAEQLATKVKPRYDGHCRERGLKHHGSHTVVRFRNPDDGEVTFDDRVRGAVSIANRELDDLVIRRPDGSPTYNFCVVIDDIDMRISDVIRGDDHINNTPRQINIYRALGVEPPRFAHVPMILGGDGARLSKRHGAVSVLQYRDDGYLPHALINYLARLGWSHGDQEVFSRADLIRHFKIETVQRKAAAFNHDKLNWLNQYWLRNLPASETARHLEWHMARAGLEVPAGPPLAELIAVQAERTVTLRQMVNDSRVYYEDTVEYDSADAEHHLRPAAAEPLALLRQRLAVLAEWRADALAAEVKATARELEIGMGKVAQPLRVALTGRAQSPAIDKTLLLTGRERTLDRLDRALAWIRNRG